MLSWLKFPTEKIILSPCKAGKISSKVSGWKSILFRFLLFKTSQIFSVSTHTHTHMCTHTEGMQQECNRDAWTCMPNPCYRNPCLNLWIPAEEQNQWQCQTLTQTYPMAAKANSSRASNGNSVLRLVLNTAVMVSEIRCWVCTATINDTWNYKNTLR